MIAPLATIYRNKDHPESEHLQATNILTDYASDDASLIANLLIDAAPNSFAALFRVAQTQSEKVIPFFRSEIDKKSAIPENDKDSELVKDRLQANGNPSPFRHHRQRGLCRAIPAVLDAGRHHD